jgi:hypothetical protein
MTKHSAFIVPDALTLLAVCQKYPHGFVGVGTRPRDLYCCPRVCDNNDVLAKLVFRLNGMTRGMQFFLLLPNPEAACALWYDMEDPKCKACGRPVRDH